MMRSKSTKKHQNAGDMKSGYDMGSGIGIIG